MAVNKTYDGAIIEFRRASSVRVLDPLQLIITPPNPIMNPSSPPPDYLLLLTIDRTQLPRYARRSTRRNRDYDVGISVAELIYSLNLHISVWKLLGTLRSAVCHRSQLNIFWRNVWHSLSECTARLISCSVHASICLQSNFTAQK